MYCVFSQLKTTCMASLSFLRVKIIGFAFFHCVVITYAHYGSASASAASTSSDAASAPSDAASAPSDAAATPSDAAATPSHPAAATLLLPLGGGQKEGGDAQHGRSRQRDAAEAPGKAGKSLGKFQRRVSGDGRSAIRSEEHTSELQSPCNLV